MGFIYKIVNDLNEKVYVGKTIRTLSIRWEEHLAESKLERAQLRPIYRAFNKYGIKHFNILEIEECFDYLLNEREKYWISYYDSYQNGYNATSGGDGGTGRLPTYSKELEQQIINKYLEIKSCTKVGKEFGYSRWTIATILKKNNIEIVQTQSIGQPVAQYNKDTKELLQIFPSAKAVQKTLGFSDANIGKCCKGQRKTAYGYIWKYITLQEYNSAL